MSLNCKLRYQKSIFPSRPSVSPFFYPKILFTDFLENRSSIKLLLRLTQKIDYIKMALIVLHPHTTGQKNRLSFFPKTFNGFGLLLFFEFNGIIPKEKYVCFYQGTLGYQQFYKKFNIKKHFKIRKNIWCYAAFFGNNYTVNINKEYFIKCLKSR